jgi:hypothetical protein
MNNKSIHRIYNKDEKTLSQRTHRERRRCGPDQPGEDRRPYSKPKAISLQDRPT